ncbi:MAG: membrane protein insertion efficiency factor YidD [Bacteroidetes bacterium]|nr:membrane protein insertion efficiency factor YidD [Bacteroidota bacterium]
MKYIIIVCLIFGSVQLGFTQTQTDIKMMRNLLEFKEHQPDYSFAFDNKNELEIMLAGLFLGYKKFISSQDGSNCSFTPTCSEYAMQSVKQKGVIIGIINGFDRLTRCNSLSADKYEIHPETHLLSDPVE